MTQEEKAIAYDKAIEKIKYIMEHGVSPVLNKEDLQDLFPEIQETDDEKIRKWIIDDIRYNMNNEPLNNSEYKKEAEKAIAWLEKQGEQKSVDDLTQQEAMDIAVAKCFEQSEQKPTLRERYDNIAKSEWFKRTHEGMSVSDEEPKWSDDDEQYLLVCKNALHKYQVSDKWDADIISKWLEDKLKQGEPKSKWSEEDERHENTIIRAIHGAGNITPIDGELAEKWLKSIKQRMEEQQ